MAPVLCIQIPIRNLHKTVLISSMFLKRNDRIMRNVSIHIEKEKQTLRSCFWRMIRRKSSFMCWKVCDDR